MPNLEPLFRPFETGDIAPPRAGVASTPAAVPNVVVIAGASGNGKTFSGSFAQSVTHYMVKQPRETVED